MALNTTLKTVTDYISDARTLLQDTLAPYRYDDPSLLVALNVTLLEARRLRPDLFVYNCSDVPTFGTIDNTEVVLEAPFRLALVYGLCAHAMARDQEDYQDARYTTFLATFSTILLGTGLPPIAGGSPPGGKQ